MTLQEMRLERITELEGRIASHGGEGYEVWDRDKKRQQQEDDSQLDRLLIMKERGELHVRFFYSGTSYSRR